MTDLTTLTDLAKTSADGREYKPSRDYQERLRELIAKYPYRLDTNFAKMDRIVHREIEAFKTRVCNMRMHGKTVGEWGRLFNSGTDSQIKTALRSNLGITDQDAEQLVK